MNVPEFQQWMLERDSYIQAAANDTPGPSGKPVADQDVDDGSDDDVKNTQQNKPVRGSVKQGKASDKAIK